MVKPETYNFDKRGEPLRTARFIAFQPIVTMKKLERAANGAWFAVFNIRLEFAAPPGERTILIDKTIRVRGSQEGKLPHPNAFGRGKSGKSPKNRK